MPATADRDCQICFALGHHGAVPVDLFAAARPNQQPLSGSDAAAVAISLAAYLLFHPRAPPRA